MAFIYCLCRILMSNSKFGIRLLQFDSGISVEKQLVNSCKKRDYIRSPVVRCQSTRIDHLQPGTPRKRRSKKKVIDVIRVEGESVSEGKAKVKCVTHQSFDHTLGLPPAVSSHASEDMVADFKSSSTSLETSNRLSKYLGEEVSLQKFSNLLKNGSSEKLPTIRNVSEQFRWNKGVNHTYDADFMVRHNIECGEEVFSNNYFDFYLSSELQNSEVPSDTHSSTCHLSTLSSPLDGFAKVDKINILEEETSVKNNGISKRKPKKKVSSKREESDIIVKNILEKSVPSLKGVKGKVTKKKQQLEQHYANVLEMKHMCKEVLFLETLVAFLDVSVNVGLEEKALETLLHYRHLRHLRNEDLFGSIEPYNILLQGFANKGNHERMEYVRNLIKKDMVAMNENSFASYLAYFGCQPASSENIAKIKNIFDMMDEAGIDIQKVFSTTYQDYDSILNAVHQVYPDFVVIPENLNSSYDCHLIESLNNTLHSNKVRPLLAGLVTEKDFEDWLEEQLSMEIDGELTIPSVEKKEENSEIIYFREKLRRWQTKWKNTLNVEFAAKVKHLESVSDQLHDKNLTVYPHLICLPQEKYIKIMMQEIDFIANGSESHSLARNSLYKRLGLKVFRSYVIHRKIKNDFLTRLKAVYKKYASWMLQDYHGDGVSYIPRVYWEELLQSENLGVYLHSDVPAWPSNVCHAVGQFLYSILFKHVMIWKPLHNEKYSYTALYEIDRSYNFKIIEEIKPAPILTEIYRRASRTHLHFPSYMSPMVVPPVPWTTRKNGGYLFSNADIVRLPYSASKQLKMIDQCEKQQLYPTMDSLSQLGCVPWSVNEPMLDLIIKIFNDKGWREMGIPASISELAPFPKVNSSLSAKERKIIMQKQLEYHKIKSESYSLWCDALYKLSFANYFRNRIMWFPHNMDFRGRVYPIPPYFNHMSSDLFRSILCFARGEKLGSRGLQWLKIHLINLTGHMEQESLDDRLKYFDTVIDDILDSADNPLEGKQWWVKCDEPWQTLAACKELAAAIRSDNPEEYVSRIPVHQDGSCNGLQHYAALGRDIDGAISVNLTPCKTPHDVYSTVAELVEKARKKDAMLGNKIASTLEGYVKRKVIKQTVMTTVYGVTRYGARLQVEKQLKDLKFPPESLWQASLYISSKTFESIAEMFTSAKEIQDWFTSCARSVSKICLRNMEWITPLGFPVVQPYSVPLKLKDISNQSVPPTSIEYLMQPHAVKQKNAFPPNFIHSLDSCHMMLTSLYSQKAGITYASIHDCYWTHACSVDIMNKICREQFVRLHSQPILEDLSKYMKSQFSFDYNDFNHDGSVEDNEKYKLNEIIANVPRKGDFDIKQVLDSMYFFS